MKKLIGLVFALGALAAFAPAQIVKKGNGYLFRMKFSKGAVIRYTVKSTSPGLGGPKSPPMKINFPMVWNVLNVQGGVATIKALVGPVMLGQQQVLAQSQTTVSIDGRGQSVGNTSTGQQITPTLPLNPIRVGASWSATMPIQGAAGAQSDLTATYKFVGIKNVGGKQVALLSITTKGASRGSGTMQLLVSDGTLFSSHLSVDLKIQTPDGGTMNRSMVADIKRS